MNIILIGFMGSGKSTVAKSLSKLLDLSVLEMDDLVYQKTNTQSMKEVFLLGGENLLREMEFLIAKECASQKNLIISTGGGVVLNPVIIASFKEAGGKIIFLRAKFETVQKRLQRDNSRPLMKDAKKLYDFRQSLYIHAADEIIDVDFLSPDEIALNIQKMVHTNGL